MAGNAKDAWNEVGERFASWGRLVGDRYREAEAEVGEGESMSEGSREAQRKLEESARELTEQLNRAFTALGDTLRDPKAKEDLKGAVRAIGEAVTVTVTQTSDEIRKRLAGAGSVDATRNASSPRDDAEAKDEGKDKGSPAA
jgi:hypothetical protein